MQQEHTSKQYDAEMEAIRSGVLTMGGMVERQLVRAVQALKTGDLELVGQVLDDERLINAMQVDVDQQCSSIIVRRQPAAIDLRMVMTVSQIMNDLERIGDEAKKIALRAQQIHSADKITLVRYNEINHVAELARQMLQIALDCYARRDCTAAVDVVTRDDEVDTEFLAIMRQLISYMMEDPRTISPALDIIFIAKSIERIGDHAKNIAEYVIHIVKGKDVRHFTRDELHREASR